MNIGDVVGQKVMVVFHSSQGLARLGIDECTKYCRVAGFDNIGLWVENPSYEETPIRDDAGQIIPPAERVKKRYVAHILIPWGNVRAIVAFPDRERAEPEPESEETRIIGSYL
jgi:hypothetical protein